MCGWKEKIVLEIFRTLAFLGLTVAKLVPVEAFLALEVSVEASSALESLASVEIHLVDSLGSASVAWQEMLAVLAFQSAGIMVVFR